MNSAAGLFCSIVVMFHALCNLEVIPPSSYQVLTSPLQILLHTLRSKLLVIRPWLFKDAELCVCDAEKLMVMISRRFKISSLIVLPSV